MEREGIDGKGTRHRYLVLLFAGLDHVVENGRAFSRDGRSARRLDRGSLLILILHELAAKIRKTTPDVFSVAGEPSGLHLRSCDGS